jgi:hypothetical protein
MNLLQEPLVDQAKIYYQCISASSYVLLDPLPVRQYMFTANLDSDCPEHGL